MTYLDLLNRVKDGTQPKYVMLNDDIYVWGCYSYRLIYNDEQYLSEELDETAMISKNCIWEVEIKKDEPETKTLGDIIAEKCF